MNKNFHNFLMGVSVLPALMVMPAVAMHHVEGTDEVIQDVENLNLTEFGVLYTASGNDITGVLYAPQETSGTLVQKNITIGGTGEGAIGRAVQARNGAALVIGDREETESINISTADGYGILALGNKDKTTGSNVKVYGKTVNVTALDGTAVHVGNNTKPSEGATNQASITIDADTINVSSAYIGFGAMSEGRLYITGDTTINAENAILTRGDAQTYINKNTNHSLKMDGNIAFDYDKATSGTPVDAVVDVTFAGADSYWTGNTIASHGTGRAPDDTYMRVDSISVTMKDGATWNATKIIDNTDDETVGSWYVAMNNLTIDNGIVNIADTTRGIIVENANIADATFNGGKVNVGTMNLTGGTNTFNNNVVGVNNTSALNIENGATMNIGTNNIDVANIDLDGTLVATVRDGDAQITAGTFGGDGNLSLVFNKAGTYHVFGNEVFASAKDQVTSTVYDISWANEDKDVIASLKSVEDIASDNQLTNDSAVAIAGMSQSTSEALNEVANKIQERLASGSVEDKAVVEQATKAINPEKASVVQSATTSVQNTVTNLASNRMSLPTVGHNGGDVNLTAGGVWAQGLYNKSKMNGQFNGYTRGVAAGIDGTLNNDVIVGLGYAFNHSDVDLDSRDTDINSNTVFLYGQYKPSEWYANAMFNYTFSDYKEEGDVLGTPVKSDYNTNAFGGQIATGYDFAGGITPELGLRYLHVNDETYTNSLGVKNKLNSADYLTAVLGTKYGFNIVTKDSMLFRPELRYAVKYDMISDKSSAVVTMPGVAAYTLNGDRLSRIGGEFGIGLSMKYNAVDLSLSYDIEVREEYTSQTGMLKFRYNF